MNIPSSCGVRGLPVPSLWLDVFQKIKALGYSGVSFYTDWALLEGQQGHFIADGVFSLDAFFQAASEAGIYLLARPGPYINAEVSGGGFPGWLQRTEEVLRTPDYIKYTQNYVKNIAEIIAEAQITNGGPVILLQPENEYSQATPGTEFPNGDYFQAVENQYRDAGIVVPFISNDARPQGYEAPGTGNGSVDIYGHDAYPLGFDCANPYTWPEGALPTDFHTLHLNQSPSTPYSLVEFQGGSFDPWGGSSFAKCTVLLNEEFERVFYKNDFSFGVTVFNLYMTFGGTNWGNLGHPGGYTSYDYGAVIAEDRTVSREKYSEAKLLANFLQASPAYLTATPGNGTNGSFVTTEELAVTPLFGNVTRFYVVRHANYSSLASTKYRISVNTTRGTINIPQLSSDLTLNGRDSKIHVTDYELGRPISLLYSTADIFTWKSYGSMTVLILYSGLDETNEIAFTGAASYITLDGSGIQSQIKNDSLVLNWATTAEQKVVQVGQSLRVYLLDRNDAYNYWVLSLPSPAPVSNFSSPTSSSVIVKGGYLLRTASINNTTLDLTGDINSTTSLVVIGSPSPISALTFNNVTVPTTREKQGLLCATIPFTPPNITLPSLADLRWKYIESLPEIQPTYDDHLWPNANKTASNNPRNLTTPTSLYASDYGFNTGTLLYRGHFTATGNETTFFIETQGGTAFAHSVFLNSTHLGSWPGTSTDANYNQTLSLPPLQPAASHTLTVIVDTMGLDENGKVGTDSMKNPRGILRYSLSDREPDAITWKITGNLGGEAYIDKVRGPLNEGGLFAERQGYHLPSPPSMEWAEGNPIKNGTAGAGIAFYTTNFTLNLPVGWDIPLAFEFTNTTNPLNGRPTQFRSHLYINGWQFGKYVNNIGPQTVFPVPQGILDYHGPNALALSLWSLEDDAAVKVGGLKLVSTAVVQSGYAQEIEMSSSDRWVERVGAY
ncbi:MAG: hypothetical protein Q9191_003359 [Dirinaria sp. TL-2023a]